jgi:hypothetical protein
MFEAESFAQQWQATPCSAVVSAPRDTPALAPESCTALMATLLKGDGFVQLHSPPEIWYSFLSPIPLFSSGEFFSLVQHRQELPCLTMASTSCDKLLLGTYPRSASAAMLSSDRITTSPCSHLTLTDCWSTPWMPMAIPKFRTDGNLHVGFVAAGDRIVDLILGDPYGIMVRGFCKRSRNRWPLAQCSSTLAVIHIAFDLHMHGLQYAGCRLVMQQGRKARI